MTDLDAYFARIGYAGPREPTLPALRDVFGLPVEPAWRPLIERAAAMPAG